MCDGEEKGWVRTRCVEKELNITRVGAPYVWMDVSLVVSLCSSLWFLKFHDLLSFVRLVCETAYLQIVFIREFCALESLLSCMENMKISGLSLLFGSVLDTFTSNPSAPLLPCIRIGSPWSGIWSIWKWKRSHQSTWEIDGDPEILLKSVGTSLLLPAILSHHLELLVPHEINWVDL